MHTKVEGIQLTLHDLQSQHSSSQWREAQMPGSEGLRSHGCRPQPEDMCSSFC